MKSEVVGQHIIRIECLSNKANISTAELNAESKRLRNTYGTYNTKTEVG